MDVASGEDTVFVRFLDYGFFVPTEGAEGKRTVVEGEAFYDTLTVPMLKHYAEDAGKSKRKSTPSPRLSSDWPSRPPASSKTNPEMKHTSLGLGCAPRRGFCPVWQSGNIHMRGAQTGTKQPNGSSALASVMVAMDSQRESCSGQP